jgi:hypothetical protein
MTTTRAIRIAALVASLALHACATDDALELADSEQAVALPAPTNLEVTVISPTGVRLTWDPSPGATKYVVQRGPTPGSETTIVSVLAPTTTWSYNHLARDSTTCWVVRNLNATRELSAPSNEVCVSTATAPVPSAPGAVTATALSSTRIQVAWAPVADADHYRVYAAAVPATPVYLSTVTHPTASFIHAGLTPGTTYGYAVEAVNEVGVSARSPVVTATAPTPGVPSSVTATAISPSQITVAWAPVADATSYQILAAVSPAPPEYIATVLAAETAFTHAGLAEETTYGYQVRAVTPDGVSPPSTPIATATTPRDRPPAVPPPTGECRAAWCWVYPLPQGNVPRDVWGASANDVWVIGDRGAIARHHDGAWTSYSQTAVHWPAGVGQLWGSGPNDVWAVVGTGGVLRWNGASWSAMTSGIADARAIGGTGPTDVWAYGASPPSFRRWTGSSWRTYGLPASGWETIAIGGTTGGVRVVSRDGGIARWTGSDWSILSAGGRPANDAVVIDATHVILAQSDRIAFWNGTTWTNRTPPTAGPWTSIAASSFDDVWIARAQSSATTPMRYHWNGATWTAVDVPAEPRQVMALWATAGSAWAATADAEVEEWTGAAWTARTIGDNTVRLTGGTDDDDIWIISDDEEAFHEYSARHWDGVAWQSVAFPFRSAFPADHGYQLNGIWAAAPDDVWIAGGHLTLDGRAQRILAHWDGTSWSRVGPFGSEDGADWPQGFTAIWGAAADDVYAAAHTALYHYDGAAWTVVPGVPGGSDVFGTGASDVHVLNGADVWHWNGTAWSSRRAPQAVWRGTATSPTDVWLVGSTGNLHHDGTTFRVLESGGSGTRSIPLGTATDMFTFTSQMTRWVGGASGTPEPSPIFFDAFSSWRSPTGRIYAAGNGLLVHPPEE